LLQPVREWLKHLVFDAAMQKSISVNIVETKKAAATTTAYLY
jgi:hypothetical protein